MKCVGQELSPLLPRKNSGRLHPQYEITPFRVPSLFLVRLDDDEAIDQIGRLLLRQAAGPLSFDQFSQGLIAAHSRWGLRLNNETPCRFVRVEINLSKRARYYAHPRADGHQADRCSN